MRQPQSRCKTCHAVASNSNREAKRRYDRRRYRRTRNDPEAWARRLEDMRFQYRARRGVARVNRRQYGTVLLDSAPFADWLRWIVGRDDTSIKGLAVRFGVGDKTLREALKGRDVELATVERALIADDTIALRELYPCLYEG